MSRKRKVSHPGSIAPIPVKLQKTDNLNMIVAAKNPEQKELLKSLSMNTITFVRGPAGSGKTFLAVTYAIQQLLSGKCQRIVFTRPVIEAAGEHLGYLPGNLVEKLDPYMMPIYETLAETVPSETLNKIMPRNSKDALVRIIPLAFMRGVTFKNSYVIADEIQNATPEQIRLLLTRLGDNSKIIVCGDTRQSDIKCRNGLEDAFSLLQDIEGIGFVSMTDESIVRHPLIQKIEQRYEEKNKKTK